MQKVARYILPIAEIYSYCLLPNHFHFLLRIKSIDAVIQFYEQIIHSKKTTPEAKQELEIVVQKLDAYKIHVNKSDLYQAFISKQFANLFSSYTQSFNKKYERKGSLFMKNFKRKEIDSTAYLHSAIKYIHRNPIHHGIVTSYALWRWSSYQAYLSLRQSSIFKDEILQLVGSIDEFIKLHESVLGMDKHNEFEFD